MEQLLKCENLTKRYGYKTALDSINLNIDRGRIIGLLGPNGSGKTTLIKLINGLLSPSEGALTINGFEPGPETKKIVSYLPERTYFNSWMKVTDILDFFCDFYADFDRNRAMEMLHRLNINELV
jgi:ABC-2 type transport system ATP-binding protein